MCGCWPPRIATWRKESSRAISRGPVLSHQRHVAGTAAAARAHAAILRSWSIIFLVMIGRLSPMRWRCSNATPGPATCGSSSTCWSEPRFWPKAIRFVSRTCPGRLCSRKPQRLLRRRSPLDTDDLNTFQRQKVLEVMQREGANKAKVARTLGISRRKLYRLLERYGFAEAASKTAELASEASAAGD